MKRAAELKLEDLIRDSGIDRKETERIMAFASAYRLTDRLAFELAKDASACERRSIWMTISGML